MQTFLIVTAAVVFGLFLFLWLAVWYIKRKFKKLFGELGDALKGLAAGLGSTPQLRMNLEPAGDSPAHHPAEIAETTELLAARGYADAGRFLPNGSPAVVMHLFWNGERNLAAVAYDTQQNPPQIDVAASFEDGRYHFASNVSHDGHDKPPNYTYERQPDWTNEQLLDAADGIVPDDGRVIHAPDRLPQFIKDCYEAEMIWRANRGGYTDQEIRRSIEASGNEVTSQAMEMSKAALNGALSGGIETELRENFLQGSELSAARWEKIEDRFALIHPMTNADDLARCLHDLYPEEEPEDEDDEDDTPDLWDRLQTEAEAMLANHSPVEAFMRLARQAPRFAELEHLGHIEDPVPAEAYALPEQDDGEDDYG
ncbi:MAG: hypothetical protein AAGD32_15525 [Planctomycetota bacterium]